jgi:hypothetical protein
VRCRRGSSWTADSSKGALAATNPIDGLRRDLMIAVVAALVVAALSTVMDRESGQVSSCPHR